MRLHKIFTTIFTVLVGLTIGGLSASAKSQPKLQYQVIKQHFGQYLTYYRAKYPKKNIYGWNAKHTKKLYNLKRYSDRELTSDDDTEILQHGNVRSHYIRITFYTKQNKVKTAYVWHGYVEKGAATQQLKRKYSNLDFFYNNVDYQNYIRQSKPQAISRAIVKLFPHSKVTLDATQVAVKEDGFYATDQITPRLRNVQIKTGQYQKIVKFPKIVKYLGDSRYEKTSVRIKEVKKLLSSYGYSAKKRAKLSKNYQIGLNVVDKTWLPDYVAFKYDYGDAFVLAESK